MEENKKKNNENTESFGTGILSSLIFVIIAIIAMIILSKYYG